MNDRRKNRPTTNGAPWVPVTVTVELEADPSDTAWGHTDPALVAMAVARDIRDRALDAMVSEGLVRNVTTATTGRQPIPVHEVPEMATPEERLLHAVYHGDPELGEEEDYGDSWNRAHGQLAYLVEDVRLRTRKRDEMGMEDDESYPLVTLQQMEQVATVLQDLLIMQEEADTAVPHRDNGVREEIQHALQPFTAHMAQAEDANRTSGERQGALTEAVWALSKAVGALAMLHPQRL